MQAANLAPVALDPNSTSSQGFFQGELVVLTAIKAALADVRQNPWLIDFAFVSLTQDPLLAAQYGQADVDAAKKWFAANDIQVRNTPLVDKSNLPCVTVQLNTQNETEQALGDVNTPATEPNDQAWPDLSPVFAPLSYDPVNGILAAPPNIQVGPGQVLVDALGLAYPITDVDDDNVITLVAPPVGADFSATVVRSARPAQRLFLESVNSRDAYSIGVHVAGPSAAQLTWLTIIVWLCLLRYKRTLIEGRGFERTVITLTGPAQEASLEGEIVYERYFGLTGYSRQFWPTIVAPKIDIVTTQVAPDGSGDIALSSPGVDPADQLLVGDDNLSGEPEGGEVGEPPGPGTALEPIDGD